MQNGIVPPPSEDRAFYFIIVLWGERFRSYFLQYCLPSLLSPGNVPALDPARRSKFLIATRPEDWEAMRRSDPFRRLERYVETVYLEIPPCPPDNTSYQHMGIGHRMASEMAHRDRTYAVVLTPDSMLSEGSVARLQELAGSGTEVVLTAALRFGEEPFLANLHNMGVLPAAGVETNDPLVITGRQMVHAAVNGFHSETLAYEWDTPGLMAISPAAWWRVPGEDGIVLHSLSWAPLLLDYSAIAAHDTSTFDQWTFDGDYVFNNFKHIERLHIVQDSDEMFIASWGPLAEHAVSKTRFPLDRYLAGHFFRQSFYSGFFDPLKRKLFFLPVRWHAEALNGKWTAVEERAMRGLLRWVEPPSETNGAASKSGSPQPERFATVAARLPLSALRTVAYVWIFRHRIVQYAGRLLRGERKSFARIAWFLRSFVFGATHS